MIDMTELDDQLGKVNFSQFADLPLDDEITAKFWRSDYAEIFIVDAFSLDKNGLDGFLQKLDTAIASRLRKARDEGEQREVHVCIVFDSGSVHINDLKPEAEISRYVSRKYWIKKDNLVEQVLERLSLAWVDIQAKELNNSSSTPLHLQELRERIANKKGTGAAKQFLESLA
jgi:hypothetical protein